MGDSSVSTYSTASPELQDRDAFLIRNQMPTRLEIRGETHTLKLAPLQQVRVGYQPHKHLGPAAVHALTDRAVAWEKEPVRSTRVVATAWLTLVGTLTAVTAVASLLSDPRASWVVVTTVTVACLCIVAAAALNRPDSSPDDELQSPDAGSQRLTGWRFTKDVALSALQKFALIVVLAVGVLGPTAAIYYGTEMSDVLSFSTRPSVDIVTDESSYPIIVARCLQIVLVVTLSLIPGLMYFQFDREKLTTLMDRWVHHAFRLDPTLKTLSDVDAKYGRRVEEFYGATFDCGVATAKRRITSRSPLFVATLLLALGWIVVLLNSPADLAVQGGSLVREGAPAQDLPTIQRFIQPAYTPMTCAFLGAYFFTAQLVLLGYVRGDLRPKTYNVVSVRILVAVILAWMLQGLFGTPDWVLAASFLGGLVPDTVLRYIRDAPSQLRQLGSKLPNPFGPRGPSGGGDADRLGTFDERSPLTALDGIGIYERTRLAEEGITSIQALARHDLVDLMLSSRIPASRLIDWLDQALLYQHVTSPDRRQLRRAGIRTATELLGVCRNPHLKPNVVRHLDSDGDGASRLPLILTSLRGDEWLTYITHWRAHDDTREPGRTVYTDAGLQITLMPAQSNGGRRGIEVLELPDGM